jgi:hypothetical protein
MGDLQYRLFTLKEMANSSIIEIEKFNGKQFELWKLKIEDILAEKDQWIIVIQVLHLHECQQKIEKIWIRR